MRIDRLPIHVLVLFPYFALMQQFWAGPDNIPIVFHNEWSNEDDGLPQPNRALYGTFVVRMSLALQEEDAIGWRRLLPYWVIGIEQRDGAKFRALLPMSPQFLTGKLDGKRHRPDFAFPKLHGGTTESELFPRLDLRVSYFFPPLFEFPNVHSIILNSQAAKHSTQPNCKPTPHARP